MQYARRVTFLEYDGVFSEKVTGRKEISMRPKKKKKGKVIRNIILQNSWGTVLINIG